LRRRRTVGRFPADEFFQPRALSRAFVDALKCDDGLLRPLLDRVKNDHSLMMALRGKYINVYYRGGSLMKVERKSEACDAFIISFDPNYSKPDSAAPPERVNEFATSGC
jgi:hypothetical protein